MSTTTLSFAVDSTDKTVPLGFEAWLDHQLILNVDWVQEKVNFSYDFLDDDGEHCLTLKMKNKTSEHTTISDSGQIINDACLTVSALAFDDLALGQIFIDQATYTHNFNNTELETTEKFYGNMGCNGTVNLKFSTPIYLWLLENM